MRRVNHSVRVTEYLTNELASRGRRGTIINRDLTRYYRLLEQTQSAVCGRFAGADWAVIEESVLALPAAAGLITTAAVVERQDYALALCAKRSVDPRQLLAKLAALTPAQDLCVVDAAERWLFAAAGRQPTTTDPFILFADNAKV